jgi:hypothetical protein
MKKLTEEQSVLLESLLLRLEQCHNDDIGGIKSVKCPLCEYQDGLHQIGFVCHGCLGDKSICLTFRDIKECIEETEPATLGRNDKLREMTEFLIDEADKLT